MCAYGALSDEKLSLVVYDTGLDCLLDIHFSVANVTMREHDETYTCMYTCSFNCLIETSN